MLRSMTSAGEPIGRRDIVLAGLVSLVAVAFTLTQAADDAMDVSAFAAPLALAFTVPLLWRRAAPLAALAATLAGLLVHVALFGDSVIRCGPVLSVAFVLVFSAGVRLDRGASITALAVALGVGILVCITDEPSGADAGAITFVAPLTAVLWGIGLLVRSRGRMARELQARTVELRRTRDEHARLEVAGDRERLSVELDALLQRRLGELARLAEMGGDADPDVAGDAFRRIERDARATLQEMRSVVGVLRDDEADAATAPQPTLTQLDALLVRSKGPGARLTVEGRPRVLPAGVELSAYRVCEHLLEAIRDAPGVEVHVRFADQALELRVSGPMRRRGAAAIERARERARLHHGDVRTTSDAGRTEALVSLPIFVAA